MDNMKTDVKTTIHDFLPEEQGEDHSLLVQARIPRHIGLEVRKRLRKAGISWAQFVRAACEEYLSGQKPKTK